MKETPIIGAGLQDTRALATRIRGQALCMVTQAKASHIGSALSIADIVAVLYGRALRVNPAAPRHPQRDRFILSKGHACVAVYAALAETGFIDRRLLQTYGTDGSMLMAHISHKVPGAEFSTGALGHGLPFGTGKAMAAKRRGEGWRTVVLTSDGEWGEGSNWEAALFAAHHGLDNLVCIIDYNKLQSLKSVDETLRLEPLHSKFEAFGWAVREVDGHDHDALIQKLEGPPWESGKPMMLIAHTTKGKGVSFMENKVEWHYRNPTAELLDVALAEIEGPAGNA
ncbi:transketolase [Sphingobium sp. CCH11-B1]|jgi:transketolase|uniref:transketolase n=1 Tax=Sphingobium sp. CCH11-B1 TaxID=1768781 RepID=UPI00082CCF42|nr:transketolase [Sphingobium sp. CCH11-B1]MEA3389546.1 transketolase [Pseudomonadota bacterium]